MFGLPSLDPTGSLPWVGFEGDGESVVDEERVPPGGSQIPVSLPECHETHRLTVPRRTDGGARTSDQLRAPVDPAETRVSSLLVRTRVTEQYL